MSKIQLTCHYTQTTEITSSYLVAGLQTSDAMLFVKTCQHQPLL